MSLRPAFTSSLILLLLVACASDPLPAEDDPAASADTITIRGELSYLPRIALPPDAEAVVELRAGPAPSGDIIAQRQIALEGRQVPVPFTLEVDRADFQPGRVHVFQGALISSGQSGWISAPEVIDAAARSHDLRTIMLERDMAPPLAVRLKCGAREARVVHGGDQVVLEADGMRFTLRPVEAASGARYRRPGDARTEYWNRDGRATLRVQGEDWPECELLPDEPVLVARGNEPGWRLDLDVETLTLSWDYGAASLAAATPEAVRSDRVTSYGAQVGDRRLVIAIHDRLCADDMTGMPHPKQVIVSLDARTLRGCGGEPKELLLGEWVVEELDGRGIVDNSRATVTFSEDGTLGGRGSCNSYGGSYALTGEGLTVSQLHSTLMACAQPLMAQERRLFEVLQQAYRFEISDDGALILHGGDGRTLTARR